MAETTSNVIGVKIEGIWLSKWRGQEKLNIMPQFFQMNIYQSLIMPTMKAELMIVDPIGLFYNYPMIGEEYITFQFRDTMDGDSLAVPVIRTLEFGVAAVTEATPTDTVRGQVYVLDLYPLEMRVNATERIQKAYHNSYDEIIKDILKWPLQVHDQKMVQQEQLFEKSHGQHSVVIPNMKPFQACAWLASRAVPERYNDHSLYFFYETFNGYNFRTLEDMLEGPWQNKGANVESKKPARYAYISNATDVMVKQISRSLHVPEHNMITAMQIQKRWNTMEKIIGGYFENEYLDIDIWNKTIKSTPTLLEVNPTNKVANTQVFNMNTKGFVEDHQHQSSLPGTKTRVRYTISQANGDQFDDPQQWEERWGKAIQNQIALSQVVVTTSVPGDTRLNVGDTIEVFLPQFQGFTSLDKDQYLAGTYVITDLKHTFSFGSNHVTTLNISRNSYNEDADQKMKYNVGGSNG